MSGKFCLSPRQQRSRTVRPNATAAIRIGRRPHSVQLLPPDGRRRGHFSAPAHGHHLLGGNSRTLPSASSLRERHQPSQSPRRRTSGTSSSSRLAINCSASLARDFAGRPRSSIANCSSPDRHEMNPPFIFQHWNKSTKSASLEQVRHEGCTWGQSVIFSVPLPTPYFRHLKHKASLAPTSRGAWCPSLPIEFVSGRFGLADNPPPARIRLGGSRGRAT